MAVRSGVGAWLIAALLWAMCGGVGDATTPDEDDRTVATVNGTPISVEDFEGSYVQYLINTGQNDTPPHRYRHLENLVDAYLLANEARRRGLDRDSVFLAFEERERRKAVGGRFYEVAFLETLPPLTDAEVREAFVKYKQQVVVRHLFYRQEASARAAYERLQAGRAFLDEAQDCYGLAVYDSLAGYLGPIRYYQVDDAFAEAAFALDVGEYSEPVRSRVGFHIIRVEDKIRNPIITESEYQTRKDGIASQARLRKRRLEGDRFVRGFMEKLDVQVNPEGVRAMALALQDLEESVAPEAMPLAPDVEISTLDVGALRASLTPQTPLATYQVDGETRVFTAGDYYFWLEDVPFAEARHRTAASIGRALRNEVFAQEGFRRGLDADDGVQRDVERATRFRLAQTLQERLRENSDAPPDESFLREAYEKLGLDQQKRWVADFWVVPFASRAEAERALRTLDAMPERAEAYAGFARFQQEDVQAVPMWGPHARQAPLGRAVLVGTGADGWAVLYVSRREAQTMPFEERLPTLAASLTPLMGELHLLRDLRRDATVTLDTLLFEQRMTLDS